MLIQNLHSAWLERPRRVRSASRYARSLRIHTVTPIARVTMRISLMPARRRSQQGGRALTFDRLVMLPERSVVSLDLLCVN